MRFGQRWFFGNEPREWKAFLLLNYLNGQAIRPYPCRMTSNTPQIDNRTEARLLYWQGYKPAEIARRLEESPPTIYSWKKRDDWDSTPVIQRVESAIDVRLTQLIGKDDKTDGDLREIETLTKSLERTARIRKYDQGGNETDLNPKLKNRHRGKRRKPKKNEIPEEGLERMREAFMDELFGYQKEWWKQKEISRRIRNILKSRQIGATYYFARESILDAAETGDNQIFLSASKAQAHVFKQYIRQFVQDCAGVDLTGDPIILSNGAHLHFLGTNFRTAQSYHGHFYQDEYFWIPRFTELNKVASGMAMHKKWRKTYFSTPSSINHEAYPFWSGKHFNRGRKKEEHIQVDISHKALKDGLLCEDRQWRHIVTIEDAVAGGCDLFDLEELRLEYSKEEYDNLLMCQFIDDTSSIFSLSDLQRCMVDSWVIWSDFKPLAIKPFANYPVWIGYDPSRSRDAAAVVVIAPPAVEGGKFRILEKITWYNMPFPEQAEHIKQLTDRYNVTRIGIDTNSIGIGVFDLVKQFFPAARGLSYSPEVKTRLVLKAQEVVTKGRLEFDAGWTDLATAFMQIHRTITAGGTRTTFGATRSEEAGHGDLAWAVMHALEHEPLQGSGGTNKSIMEIY